MVESFTYSPNLYTLPNMDTQFFFFHQHLTIFSQASQNLKLDGWHYCHFELLTYLKFAINLCL